MEPIFSESTKEHPRLELVFDEAGGALILLKASFQEKDGSEPLRNLVELPPSGKVFRAFCILLLLAKYRGEELASESDGKSKKKGSPKERSIVFRVGVKKKKTTWISTIADYFSKTPKLDLIGTYFRGHKFISGTKRSKKGLPPAARYMPAALELKNLHLSKSASLEDEPVLLEGEELLRHAKKLEQFECDREGAKMWSPCVELWHRQFKASPAGKAKRDDLELPRYDDAPPYIFSARWEELFRRVSVELQEKVPGGNWYVVCNSPLIFDDKWVNIFCEAVNNKGATIHFAYQSPNAAKECLAVKAQWQMIKVKSGREKFFDDVEFWKEHMGCWKDWANEASGEFKFYQSNVVHPFIAVMCVPPPKAKDAAPAPSAPAGTWCLLILLPLYSASENERCALCLHRPSQMLDVYYHSILQFFEQGTKDSSGFLEEVDLFHGEARYFLGEFLQDLKKQGLYSGY